MRFIFGLFILVLLGSVSGNDGGKACSEEWYLPDAITVSDRTSVWDFRAEHVLSAAALGALKKRNVLEMGTAAKTFQVANPMLRVTLENGCTYRLSPADTTPQSTPPQWLQAAGRRVPNGEPMSWTFE